MFLWIRLVEFALDSMKSPGQEKCSELERCEGIYISSLSLPRSSKRQRIRAQPRVRGGSPSIRICLTAQCFFLVFHATWGSKKRLWYIDWLRGEGRSGRYVSVTLASTSQLVPTIPAIPASPELLQRMEADLGLKQTLPWDLRVLGKFELMT